MLSGKPLLVLFPLVGCLEFIACSNRGEVRLANRFEENREEEDAISFRFLIILNFNNL